MYLTLAIAVVAFLVTVIGTPILIKATKEKGIIGKDVHKKDRPEVAELGGLAIATGIVVSLLFAIGANSFATIRTIFGIPLDSATIVQQQLYLLAALSIILMIEIVGFVDDIIGVRQHIKLLLPIAAALPLIALKITSLDTLAIPLIGALPISPLIYVLILVPLGMTAATNLTNTFAGFNGMEAGMGAVIAATLLILGWHMGSSIVMVLSAALLGSLLAFLVFNWYPSRIFPDDVGTLLIGCVIATTVIIGKIEFAGAFMLLPHLFDFLFFKVPNRLPQEVAQPWTSVLKEGNKLYPPKKSVTFAQALMRVFGGLSEKNLVLLLVGIEIVLGAIVLGLYW